MKSPKARGITVSRQNHFWQMWGSWIIWASSNIQKNELRTLGMTQFQRCIFLGWFIQSRAVISLWGGEEIALFCREWCSPLGFDTPQVSPSNYPHMVHDWEKGWDIIVVFNVFFLGFSALPMLMTIPTNLRWIRLSGAQLVYAYVR